jgi:Protein of unknown function (DUF568)
MASNTRLLSFLCLCLPILLLSSVQAQDCNSENFGNKLYSSCSSLSDLSSTIHWTYHSNGTVDVAYRITQPSSNWVAWAINPTGTGMVGANAFLAYHDSAGTLQIITCQLSSFGPTIANGTLTFTVYEMSTDYSNGAYTIYATLQLPNNSTTQNTVWQRGSSFSNGVPSAHPNTGSGSQTVNLNFLSAESTSSGSGSSRLHRENVRTELYINYHFIES